MGDDNKAPLVDKNKTPSRNVGASKQTFKRFIGAAAVTVVVAAGIALWRADTNIDPLGGNSNLATSVVQMGKYEAQLKKLEKIGDYRGIIQLGRLYALSLISKSSPRQLPSDPETLNMAENYFKKAAKLQPTDCQPLVGQALLQFAIANDNSAFDLLQQVGKFKDGTCKGISNLFQGYIHEFSGDQQKAKVMYDQAIDESADIYENFLSRDYSHTDPKLIPDKYSNRLRMLSAFRHFYVDFYADRNDSTAREFNAAINSGLPGIDIRAGTVNLENARKFLDKNDYVLLRAFVTPWEVQTVQSLYADLIDDGTIDNFDPNLSRTITYNDRISHWLGQRYTDILSAIAGEPVKHVYSFLCWHSPGPNPENRPVLLPHTDREDNEFTVSIQMHYDHAKGDPSWPIWVHAPTQEVAKAGWKNKPPLEESVELRLLDGDAVLFRGRRHIHWRDEMPTDGHSFSSLLLHYVHKHFDWKDFKFVRQVADPAI